MASFQAAAAYLLPLLNSGIAERVAEWKRLGKLPPDFEIEPLDGQDLNHCGCEIDKCARIEERGGKVIKAYRPYGDPRATKPKHKVKTQPIEATPAEVEVKTPQIEVIPPNLQATPRAAEPVVEPSQPIVAPSETEALLDAIEQDMGRHAAEPKAAAAEPKAEARAGEAPPPPPPGASVAANGYREKQRAHGQPVAEFLYCDASGKRYILVKKYIDANGEKACIPHRPEGGRWVAGVKGTPFARKIPFRLPELIAGLAADPNARVFVCEGEKDADAAAKLGLIATANQGGALAGAWTAELTGWFKALGVRRVVLLEDRDATGKAHVARVAEALKGTVADIRIVGLPEFAADSGGDLSDWLALGHGKAELLARVEAAAGATETELDEFDAGDLLMGPLPAPRQWLTLGQFCRTFLSGLVAPGDVGKTTLRLTQAIELAIGRELLGMKTFGRRRVLVVSFEDDKAELHRRLLASCMHHGIDSRELKGWLFVRDLNGGPKLAEMDAKGRRRQIGALDGMLRRAIGRTKADLLVLDPFVKLHTLNESDNADMNFLCERLVKLAQDLNIAVDSPAHTHKGAIAAGDADARRGASAQRDAGRLDYTLTVMSEIEAQQFGIAADERKRHMRLDKAKANITPAIKARWFKLAGVKLDNATADYPDGDEVQAIERWEPPERWAGMEPETIKAILDDLDVGMGDGRRYSIHNRAAARAAWRVVQKHCPDKPEAQCKDIVKQWRDARVLIEETYADPVTRKDEIGLRVDPSKRKRY
jgi:hypothetical protein